MDPLTLARSFGLETTLRCQDRLIRRDQAIAIGITEPKLAGLLRRGRWERVLPRVFAVGVDTMHPLVRVRSAWLWAGEDSVICGESAAWWLGLREEPPGLVEIIVPPARRMTTQPNVRVIRAVVQPDERLSVNRIVVTAAERTCLDLSRAGREDRLDTALRKGRTTPARLEQSLVTGRGRRGQVRARLAVAEVADNPWSAPERFVHKLFRESGITGWRANAATTVSGGRRFPDVRFDDIKLILEIDGREFHKTDEQVEGDYDRQVLLVDAGWTVLRLTVRQIQNDPAGAVRRVSRIVNRMRANAASHPPD